MDVLGRIRQLLAQRGWTEYKLSKKSGVAQSTLSNIFKRNNAPTIPILKQICDGFGITLCQFFAVDGEPISLTPEQSELLDKWNRLSKEQRKALLQLLQNM